MTNTLRVSYPFEVWFCRRAFLLGGCKEVSYLCSDNLLTPKDNRQNWQKNRWESLQNGEADHKERFQKLLSAKLFWAQWLSVKGRGWVPPHSIKEKIRQKAAIFGQKTPILALFGQFFRKFFGNFPLRGGGVSPNSAKGFLAKWFSVKGVGGGVDTPLTEKIR